MHPALKPFNLQLPPILNSTKPKSLFFHQLFIITILRKKINSLKEITHLKNIIKVYFTFVKNPKEEYSLPIVLSLPLLDNSWVLQWNREGEVGIGLFKFKLKFCENNTKYPILNLAVTSLFCVSWRIFQIYFLQTRCSQGCSTITSVSYLLIKWSFSLNIFKTLSIPNKKS